MTARQTGGNWPEQVLATFARVAGVQTSNPRTLQVTLMIASSGIMATLAIIWGALYFTYGEYQGVAVVWGYAALTYLSILALRVTRRFDVFRTTQLALTVFLPFLLMLALGGFSESSAVIVWALMAPLGALLFSSRREAAIWLLVFVVEVIASLILEPLVFRINNLPALIKSIFFAMNIGLPTVTAFVLVNHFVKEKDRAVELLEREQVETERLLLNVLPAEIATELKANGRTEAQSFDSISILFADIVGFTRLSTKLSPKQTIELLNKVFSAFDDLAEQYGVEKIRTIGDNYMCVAGVPRVHSDHAELLVSMALEMLAFLNSHNESDARSLGFRIGINSGPAVAGVVGHKKFQYDVWGDAVNVASRMESHGVEGRVQIGRETYDRVKHLFDCEKRGRIDIKGRGVVETWFVIAAKETRAAT